MKHFKNAQGEVFAFEEDGSQDHLIGDDLIEMSESEVAQMLQPTLETLRMHKAHAARMAFNNAIAQPVDANGQQWNGGMDSALAIDGAVRLVELAGGIAVELFDSSNDGHIVTIAEGQQIAAAIAADFQAKFAHKQQLMREINGADEAQLETLVWSI